ncbi:MAG TPA: hypothetical protein VGH15_12915 [Caulobacteraceae bacterium]
MAGLALLAACSAPAQPDQLAQPRGACFTRDDNRTPPFEIFQVSPPPPYSPATRDYPAASAVYPATDYVTGAIHSITAPTLPSTSGFTFRKYFLLWVNRCIQLPGVTPGIDSCRNPRTKGNGYRRMIDDGAGDKVRPAFSTYAKADACTLIQARRVLGETGGLETSARAAGLTLWDGDDRVRLAPLARRFAMPNGQMMSYFVDTCILEAAPEAPDASGIVLDYEVWDNRTPAQTVDIVRNLARLTHQRGKKLILITDPVPKPPSGLTAESVPAVIDAVDGFGSAIATGSSPGNPSTHYPARGRMRSPWEAYQTQLSVVTAGGRNPLTPQMRRKLIWNIDLNDIAPPEARQLHDEIVRQGYRGMLLARNFQREGGACDRPVNQTIACLALGRCDGRFGLDRH